MARTATQSSRRAETLVDLADAFRQADAHARTVVVRATQRAADDRVGVVDSVIALRAQAGSPPTANDPLERLYQRALVGQYMNIPDRGPLQVLATELVQGRSTDPSEFEQEWNARVADPYVTAAVAAALERRDETRQALVDELRIAYDVAEPAIFAAANGLPDSDRAQNSPLPALRGVGARAIEHPRAVLRGTIEVPNDLAALIVPLVRYHVRGQHGAHVNDAWDAVISDRPELPSDRAERIWFLAVNAAGAFTSAVRNADANSVDDPRQLPTAEYTDMHSALLAARVLAAESQFVSTMHGLHLSMHHGWTPDTVEPLQRLLEARSVDEPLERLAEDIVRIGVRTPVFQAMEADSWSPR